MPEHDTGPGKTVLMDEATKHAWDALVAGERMTALEQRVMALEVWASSIDPERLPSGAQTTGAHGAEESCGWPWSDCLVAKEMAESLEERWKAGYASALVDTGVEKGQAGWVAGEAWEKKASGASEPDESSARSSRGRVSGQAKRPSACR